MMIELHNLKYALDSPYPNFSGRVGDEGDPRVHLSPIFLDEETLTLVNADGWRYLILSFSGNKEFVLARVKEHIAMMRKKTPLAYGATFATTPEDLKKLHVNQLMGLLRMSQRQGQTDRYRWRMYDDDRDGWSFPLFNGDDIRAALAEKPHVPNKKEAKALRREASKRGT